MKARGIRKIWLTMKAAFIVLSVGAYGMVTWKALEESYRWPTVAEWLDISPGPQADRSGRAGALPRIVPATFTTSDDAGLAATTLTVIRDGAIIVCRIHPADPSRVACPQTATREN
jgi:hypothetical protein